MSTKTKTTPSVESTQDSATTTQAAPAAPGMFTNIPITSGSTTGTGTFHTVWPKKDLLGSPSRMAEKADDKVVNKGEVVKDPETGQDIHLIRIHRGKRVWYGKGLIPTTPETTPAE